MVYTIDVVKIELETRLAVWERDKGKCISCNGKAHDCHELAPRSRYGAKNMAECFRIENRCLLCRTCHEKAHTIEERKRLRSLLNVKYNYKEIE